MEIETESLIQSLLSLLLGEEADSVAQYPKQVLLRAFGTADHCALIEKLCAGSNCNPGPCRGNVVEDIKFVYRCVDCRKQINTIMCQACFADSNHVGHRYSRLTRIWREKMSSGGGICDCGDADMWKKEGNCSKHSGSSC